MKLYIKQRVFSFGDRFDVADVDGSTRYSVEGEIISLGKRLHVYDAAGHEVAFIRQKLFSFLPCYFIEIQGREVGSIVKEFTLFRPSYALEGIAAWHVQGDFWDHEYEAVMGDRVMMRLSKHWFTWGDSYELDMASPEHELLCLCIALGIDAAMAASEN